MSATFKKVYNIITSVLLVVVIIFAFLLVGVRLFGLTPYTVLSGSMEPTYHVGSLIYVKSVDPNSLTDGDPVTYHTEKGTVVTHRIIEVIPATPESEVSFRTKGDANDTPDGGDPLPASRVLGKPVFSIPYLGYVANYIQSPSGIFLAIGMCLLLMVGMFVPEILSIMFEKPQPVIESSEQGNADTVSVQTDEASADAKENNDQASDQQV